ncbi:MAG: GntR family transcriptional regulator [Bacillota bacterium]|nr:GntR family transcriptional regulator [Bacillota bacterium]HPF18617.1 GntR family transcriptional regulator [Bacillota bacterium]
MIRYLNQERPIFLQIAEMLKDAILSGAYPEDAQIPSITEFSVAYNINPATALKGVTLLVEEGLLYKKRGLGMFVASGARQQLVAQRKEGFYRDYIEPMIREARHLEIGSVELQQMTERGMKEHGDRNQ